jgi:nucleotide-binding universal stress UspA family protein
MTSEQGGRIVVGVDGSSSSTQALDWAARWAEKISGTLEMVTVWEWPKSYGAPLPVPTDFDPAAVAKQVNQTAVDALHAGHPGLDVTVLIVEGAAGQVLVERSTGAELLVVGSRGHGELVGLLIGSVSEYVTAHAHCPVAVVRHG